MAAVSKQDDASPAYVQAVEEIMRTYRSLPPRPSIEEVEAAMNVLRGVEADEQARLEEIARQDAPPSVPAELFAVLRQVRRNAVLLRSREEKKEAAYVVDLDKMFQTFDELIQRASQLVSGEPQNEKLLDLSDPVGRSAKSGIGDEIVGKKRKGEELESVGFKGLVRSTSAKAVFSPGDGDTEKLTLMKADTEKLSLMKVAAFIENTAKTGARVLDLEGKLMDQIEWLPASIGKLRDVTEFNLSNNHLMTLPSSIGSLVALTKIDLHANQLLNIPDTLGDLVKLTDIDLHANRLSSLPVSFAKLTNLVNLNLSSNQFTHLPDTIGNLTCLKRLIVETNELEEIPYTIGSCSSLVELRLDFNNLKALPEAVGKLECLEILTLHYNRIKGLPTTMGNLSNLRELDVSFNELESIPENLCFAVRLEKLNVGKNFADLRALPKSIGNLEMLEELDISDCQIRVLPDSFKLLSKLRVLRADETPLEVPPRQVVNQSAQAVVQYMADLLMKTDAQSQTSNKKRKGFCSCIYIICCSQQRSSSEV